MIGVLPGGRLVQDQDARRPDQDRGQRQPLPWPPWLSSQGLSCSRPRKPKNSTAPATSSTGSGGRARNRVPNSSSPSTVSAKTSRPRPGAAAPRSWPAANTFPGLMGWPRKPRPSPWSPPTGPRTCRSACSCPTRWPRSARPTRPAPWTATRHRRPAGPRSPPSRDPTRAPAAPRARDGRWAATWTPARRRRQPGPAGRLDRLVHRQRRAVEGVRHRVGQPDQVRDAHPVASQGSRRPRPRAAAGLAGPGRRP